MPTTARSHEAAALVGLGDYLLAAMRLDGALRCFDAALACDDGDARAHAGRGRALHRLRRPRAALRSFERALRRGADPVGIAEDAWMCAMLAGAMDTAWVFSDLVLARRRRTDLNRRDRPFHLRHVWDGTPLAGRDVLVRCYHGLGDAIQFIRYAKPLKRRARSVTVQAVPALHGLLASCAGIDRLVPLGYDEPDPPYQVDIELMELPHAMRTTLATLPAEIPYLFPARRATPQCDARLRVGLAWRAGDWDPRRSIPLPDLAALNDVAGVALINLQRGPALDEWHAAAVRPEFADDPATWTDDILDTARTIAGLDLVVAVDTMVAHLAGALGIEAWTLLHAAADWRWMVGRDDSPWYPTMRLFRQGAPGAWPGVIARVVQALRTRRSAASGPWLRLSPRPAATVWQD